MSDTFLLSDRSREARYRGRWRYRVRQIAASGRLGVKVLFKRRDEAAGFAAQAETRGLTAACRYLDQCGMRPGIDFKDDRP